MKINFREIASFLAKPFSKAQNAEKPQTENSAKNHLDAQLQKLREELRLARVGNIHDDLSRMAAEAARRPGKVCGSGAIGQSCIPTERKYSGDRHVEIAYDAEGVTSFRDAVEEMHTEIINASRLPEAMVDPQRRSANYEEFFARQKQEMEQSRQRSFGCSDQLPERPWARNLRGVRVVIETTLGGNRIVRIENTEGEQLGAAIHWPNSSDRLRNTGDLLRTTNLGDRPKTCNDCRNYHGKSYRQGDSYDRVQLICGIHPSGWEGEECPDWEEGDSPIGERE